MLTKNKFNPLDPCLHCAIAQLIHLRHAKGVEDDINEIVVRLCESLAEVCATFESLSERMDISEFAASVLQEMMSGVLSMNWKNENAGPGTKNH